MPSATIQDVVFKPRQTSSQSSLLQTIASLNKAGYSVKFDCKTQHNLSMLVQDIEGKTVLEHGIFYDVIALAGVDVDRYVSNILKTIIRI